MSDIAIGIHVVRVVQPDEVGSSRTVQLWLAAVPRERAVAAVKAAIPVGWDAELTDQQLTRDHVARIGVRAGEVRELTS